MWFGLPDIFKQCGNEKTMFAAFGADVFILLQLTCSIFLCEVTPKSKETAVGEVRFRLFDGVVDVVQVLTPRRDYRFSDHQVSRW